MTQSEGVMQYRLDYRPGPLPPGFDPGPLFAAFGECRARGLIGQDPGRYGGHAYGNLSLRCNPGFVISGIQSGGLPALTPDHLAWVTGFESAQNTLRATGPARPSSEAMSHGAVYRAALSVDAVVHVHAPALWRNAAALRLPTTDPAAGNGTPGMAKEVRRLLGSNPAEGLLAMGGHEGGIIAYAADMRRATALLFGILAKVEER